MNGSQAGCGFVYATTGPLYTDLARRAARNLRLAMPKAQVDLFTDQPVQDDTFDVIHPLDHGYFRPKMEALRRSRFERTIYLDADTIVLTDVSELFDAVDDVDLAGCQGWIRTPAMMASPDVPRCFPLINAGVLVMRRSESMDRLLDDWEREMHATQAKVDQRIFRKLLHQRKAPFLILPMEYNLINTRMLDIWDDRSGAPRILHVTDLHKKPAGDARRPFDAAELLGPRRSARLRRAIAKDGIQVSDATLPPPKPSEQNGGLRRLLGKLRRRLRR